MRVCNIYRVYSSWQCYMAMLAVFLAAGALAFNRLPTFDQIKLSEINECTSEETCEYTVASFGDDSVEVKDLPRSSTELTNRAVTHPVAAQFEEGGVTHESSASDALFVRPKRVIKSKLKEPTHLEPMPRNEGSDPRYFEHPGVCTMIDMDYQNFDESVTGNWYGLPMCGPAFGRRVREATGFDESVEDNPPDDNEFYRHDVHSAVATQYGQVRQASVIAYSPVGCAGTDLQQSPDCGLAPGRHYIEVDTITNGTSGVEAKSRGTFHGTGTLPLREHALPSTLEKEQMECKHVDSDGNTVYEDVIVPDELLIDPCKECVDDHNCPGGFHCVISSYLGLTIINGYEEECIVKQELDISPFDARKTCVPSNAPIHDLLHCDSRYSVTDIIKNMYTAGWSQLIHQYLFMSPDNGFRFVEASLSEDNKKELHLDYPFVSRKNWVFDQMHRQFEEQMVEFLSDTTDFDRLPLPFANGMFFSTHPTMNLFNSYKKTLTEADFQERFGVNLTGSQRTIRRDLSYLLNYNPFYSSCITTTTKGANLLEDDLIEMDQMFEDVNEALYQTVTDVNGNEYSCVEFCTMEMSKFNDCAFTYETGLQEFTLTDFIPKNDYYEMYVDKEKMENAFLHGGEFPSAGASWTEYYSLNLLDRSRATTYTARNYQGAQGVECAKAQYYRAFNMFLGPHADVHKCDEDAKKPFEMWNSLAMSFLDRLILGDTMDFQMCAKQFKCSDFSEAECPAEPTCRVFEGHCERITNFEHDELCESAVNLQDSTSVSNPELDTFVTKCCVKEETAYINPYDTESSLRLTNPIQVGQDGSPGSEELGQENLVHCHDRMGNKGMKLPDDLLCDVSYFGIPTFSVVRRNVMPLDLIMGVSPEAARINRYDFANASRFSYQINSRDASNGFDFEDGIPTSVEACYNHLKLSHSEEVADDFPFVYGNGLVCSLLPCRDSLESYPDMLKKCNMYTQYGQYKNGVEPGGTLHAVATKCTLNPACELVPEQEYGCLSHSGDPSQTETLRTQGDTEKKVCENINQDRNHFIQTLFAYDITKDRYGNPYEKNPNYDMLIREGRTWCGYFTGVMPTWTQWATDVSDVPEDFIAVSDSVKTYFKDKYDGTPDYTILDITWCAWKCQETLDIEFSLEQWFALHKDIAIRRTSGDLSSDYYQCYCANRKKPECGLAYDPNLAVSEMAKLNGYDDYHDSVFNQKEHGIMFKSGIDWMSTSFVNLLCQPKQSGYSCIRGKTRDSREYVYNHAEVITRSESAIWLVNASLRHDPRVNIYVRNDERKSKFTTQEVRHTNTPKSHCCPWYNDLSMIEEVDQRPKHIGCIEPKEKLVEYWSSGANAEDLKRCNVDPKGFQHNSAPGGSKNNNAPRASTHLPEGLTPEETPLSRGRIQVTDEINSVFTQIPGTSAHYVYNNMHSLTPMTASTSPLAPSATINVMVLPVPNWSQETPAQCFLRDGQNTINHFNDPICGTFKTTETAFACYTSCNSFKVFYNPNEPTLNCVCEKGSSCSTIPANTWYVYFKCEFEQTCGAFKVGDQSKCGTHDNYDNNADLLIVAEHDAFLPWLDNNGVIYGWQIKHEDGSAKAVSGRILTTTLPHTLRSGLDPSNPCHAAATTYAGYVRTAVTGDPVTDNITATWASTLMTYNLAGLKPTFRWVNCDDLGRYTEFCDNIFSTQSVSQKGCDPTDHPHECFSELFSNEKASRYSTVGHSQTGLAGKFQQLYGPKPYPVLSFETKSETPGTGPFHNSVFQRPALSKSVTSNYIDGNLFRQFGLGPTHTALEQKPVLDFRGIHDRVLDEWSPFVNPFGARFNNEYLTFSYELVTPPTLELGCDVHTAVFKNEDFASGSVRKDISASCAPPKKQRADIEQTEFIIRDAPCYCALNFYPLPEDTENNNWLFGDNGLFEGPTIPSGDLGFHLGDRVTVFFIEYEFGAASRATIKDSLGLFESRIEFESDGFDHQCSVGGDHARTLSRRCPRDFKNIDLDTTDPSTRAFFVSHKPKDPNANEGQVVQAAIKKAMELDTKQDVTKEYGDWNVGEIPSCPIYGSIPVTKRLCLGTSYDPLTGGIGVETDFTFTTSTVSRLHPLSWKSCAHVNNIDCQPSIGCKWLEGESKCVTDTDEKSKLECDLDPTDDDCWDRETSFGTKCIDTSQNEWQTSKRTGLSYDYSINSIAVQFMAAQKVGGSLSHPFTTSIAEPRTPFTRGHKSRFPKPQSVPDDYKFRPYTPGSSDTTAKQVCRCGPKPVYACIVYTPLWWKTEIGVDAMTIGDAKLDSVNVRKCGWSWGGLGAVGIAGDTGLYMGSDYTNIEIAERDILNDTDYLDVFRRTFAQQFAPDKSSLLDAIGYGDKFKSPKLMNHYRLQNGCARPPYGRWHKSSLTKKTVDNVYLREPGDDNIIDIKDEAIYSYCESINDNEAQPQFIYCADDPFSYEERKTWCSEHKDDASKLEVTFTPGVLIDPCMTVDTNDKICILFSQDKRYPNIEELIEKETSKDDKVTVVIAPISSLVRRSMQTSTRIFDIAQPDDKRRQSFDTFFTEWLTQPTDDQKSSLALTPCQFVMLASPSQYTKGCGPTTGFTEYFLNNDDKAGDYKYIQITEDDHTTIRAFGADWKDTEVLREGMVVECTHGTIDGVSIVGKRSTISNVNLADNAGGTAFWLDTPFGKVEYGGNGVNNVRIRPITPEEQIQYHDAYISKIKSDFDGIQTKIDNFHSSYTNNQCEDSTHKFMPVISTSEPLNERGSCEEKWHLQCALSQRASVIKRPVSIVCGDSSNKIVVPSVADTTLFGKRKASCTALVIASPDVSIQSPLEVDQSSCDNKDSDAFGLLATGNDVSNFELAGIEILNPSQYAVAVAFLGGFERYGSTRQTVNISGSTVTSVTYVDPSVVDYHIIFAHVVCNIHSLTMPQGQTMLVQEASEIEQFEYQPTVFHDMSFGGTQCVKATPASKNDTNTDCAYQGQDESPVDCYEASKCTPLIPNLGWVSQATVWKNGQLPQNSKVVDVGQLTNVFGAAVERTYYHPPLNHDHVLYSLIAVLGTIFILLVIAFGVIYYKGTKSHCKTD